VRDIEQGSGPGVDRRAVLRLGEGLRAGHECGFGALQVGAALLQVLQGGAGRQQQALHHLAGHGVAHGGGQVVGQGDQVGASSGPARGLQVGGRLRDLQGDVSALHQRLAHLCNSIHANQTRKPISASVLCPARWWSKSNIASPIPPTNYECAGKRSVVCELLSSNARCVWCLVSDVCVMSVCVCV
jgi:hypothetical protein